MKRNYIYKHSSKDFGTIINSRLWIRVGGKGTGEETPGRDAPWGMKAFRYYTAPYGWKGLAERSWVEYEHNVR